MTQTQEKLGSHEVLRVTSDGQFIWHPEADVMLEEGDFSHAPAMPHILKALRKQRTWVGLTDDDKVLIKHDANFNQFMTAGEYADRVQQLTEARLKDLNT